MSVKNQLKKGTALLPFFIALLTTIIIYITSGRLFYPELIELIYIYLILIGIGGIFMVMHAIAQNARDVEDRIDRGVDRIVKAIHEIKSNSTSSNPRNKSREKE